MRSDEAPAYIPPDYTSDPEDDSLLEDITDQDEGQVEMYLDEQNAYNKTLDKKEETMATTPFGGSTTAPWETNNPQPTSSTPSWGGSGWGVPARPATTQPWGGTGGNVWGGGSGWGAPKPSSSPSPTTESTINSRPKRVVICDALDCLVESYDSAGKPGLIPRAIFDLKPKFDVWEKLASFNPERLYIIFPSGELIPSFGRPDTAKVSLEYLAHSVSTYLRIPRANCVILKQMTQNLPKDRTLMSVIKDWPAKEDIVYIGIHSGRWGLSARDITAARAVGIDYIDLYNLLKGYYEYE